MAGRGVGLTLVGEPAVVLIQSRSLINSKMHSPETQTTLEVTPKSGYVRVGGDPGGGSTCRDAPLLSTEGGDDSLNLFK